MTTGDETKSTRADISALAVWGVCAAFYVLFMWFAFTDPDVLKGELGLLENTQAIFLLIGFVLAVRLALQKNENWLRRWLVLICVGVFYLLTE
jgi:DMSO/TMAO reductase YedYZ heme-binding membrane subunit